MKPIKSPENNKSDNKTAKELSEEHYKLTQKLWQQNRNRGDMPASPIDEIRRV